MHDNGRQLQHDGSLSVALRLEFAPQYGDVTLLQIRNDTFLRAEGRRNW